MHPENMGYFNKYWQIVSAIIPDRAGDLTACLKDRLLTPPAPLLTIPLIMQSILYTAAALWAVHSPRGSLWSSITPSLNQSSALPVMCWCNTSAQRQGWILQTHISGKGTCPVCLWMCVEGVWAHTRSPCSLWCQIKTVLMFAG